MPNVIIIGAGGVGSWLTPAMCMLVGRSHVTIVDGDTLEEKNLNRQLFTEEDLGFNKAERLASKYACYHESNWFSHGSMPVESPEVLMVCADNNAARNAALITADNVGCRVIIAANETHSAEAYFYRPAWSGSKLDPRSYYPQIVSDHADNPLAANSGCTGEAQVETPQLVSANFMAAALAQHLFVLWIMKSRQLDADVLDKLPFKLNSNLSRLEFTLVCDALKEGVTNENSSTNPA